MTDEAVAYKGASKTELMAVACQAIAILCDKDSELVEPNEDGSVLCTGDTCGIIIHAEDDPSALVFRTYLIDGVEESPALYALINEINAKITIGQLYYYEEERQIRYYYNYPTDKPSPEVIAYIIEDMIDMADQYDDRLKTRLGGERFNEKEEDEIEA
jgi:hypothetical protein